MINDKAILVVSMDPTPATRRHGGQRIYAKHAGLTLQIVCAYFAAKLCGSVVRCHVYGHGR